MRILTGLVSLLACLAASAALALNGSSSRADGTMETWHGDTFGARVVFGQGVDTASGLVPVEMNSAVAGRLAGKRVSVQGEMRGNTLVAAAGGVQQTGGSVVAAATGTSLDRAARSSMPRERP